MSTKLTDAAKLAGRQALIKEYYREYDKGDHGSEEVIALRSEDIEEAEALARTLHLASNLDELVGARKTLPHMFATFFPEEKQRKSVIENSIDAYIKAACETLKVEVPILDQSKRR